jgi:transcriptional regulator with XRE-family HTH domain
MVRGRYRNPVHTATRSATGQDSGADLGKRHSEESVSVLRPCSKPISAVHNPKIFVWVDHGATVDFSQAAPRGNKIMTMTSPISTPYAAPRSGDAAEITARQWVAIAQKLRDLRREKKLSVRKLGASAGVSGSLISAIELGKARPSIGSLLALCDALDTSIPVLFDESVGQPGSSASATLEQPTSATDAKASRHVQRASGRGSLELASGITLERLSRSDDPDMDFLFATYEPGAESCSADHLQTHAGNEYGFVQVGEITVTIGDESVVLGPGDSIAFASTEPHRLVNTGNGPATLLWVNLHKPPSRAALG